MGFVLVFSDGTKREKVLHYESSSCERVTRSVWESEIQVIVYVFDQAFLARDIPSEILQRNLGIDAYTDFRTVFNVIAKNGSTLERRLQTDENALRESISNEELRYLPWIPGSQNVYDELMKGLISEEHVC